MVERGGVLEVRVPEDLLVPEDHLMLEGEDLEDYRRSREGLFRHYGVESREALLRVYRSPSPCGGG